MIDIYTERKDSKDWKLTIYITVYTTDIGMEVLLC